jgi:hypothetical protein
MFPVESIEPYDLIALVSYGYVYMEVHKGMYGLPQVGILANLLARHMALHGYHQKPYAQAFGNTPRAPSLSLFVDDYFRCPIYGT